MRSIQSRFSPSQPDQRLSQAETLLRQGRLLEANALCQQMLAARPNCPETLNCLALIQQQQGQWFQAEQSLRRAIQAAPGYAAAHRSLGKILSAQNRHEPAISAFRQAIQLQPDKVDANIHLGRLLRKLGRLQEALQTYRHAAAHRRHDPQVHYETGSLLAEMDQADEAIMALQAAYQSNPDDDEIIKLLGVLLHRQGRIEEARDLLGQALFQRGGTGRALPLLQHWRCLMPDDPIAGFRLAAWFGHETPTRPCEAYVTDLFDRYADHFDDHLEQLEYRAPTVLAQRLAAVLGAPAQCWRILDAGCGTGLCGPLLRPFAAHLTGVDLSPRMVEKAGERGGYDALILAEITAFMAAHPKEYDVIFSTDTLIYFGDLEPPLHTASVALAPGGLLAFTVEQLADNAGEFRLNPSGRYAHSRAYLEHTLRTAGLTLLSIDSSVLRLERNEPVNGYLALVSKPSDMASIS